MNMTQLRVTSVALLFALTACGKESASDASSPQPAAIAEIDVYAEAVGHPGRSDADRARDKGRKPAEVLEFLGIVPGMDVLDLYSGGGYYSELVSYVVGDDGSVTSHSNEAYLGFVGDEFNARHADDRLSNVSILMAENNELELGPGSFDAALMMLTFHDLYYAAPQQGWPKIDSERMLAEIYKSLKPGGIVAIVDHYAEAGAPKETGNTLHRIDPGIVISEMQAAGFELTGSSDILRNMNDDHGKVVFDPAVRGKTDRFVLRFEKPN